jgi:DNA-binding winged helix-turn-helix (wHTH) protein
MKTEEESLGLAAFDTLRAEGEPWLLQCYVPPPIFDLTAGARSVLVFGEPGSGKSALYYALRSQCKNATGHLQRLVVEWIPVFTGANPVRDLDSPNTQVNSVLDSCALALLEFLCYEPKRYMHAPEWAQSTLIWFIRSYCQGNPIIRLGATLEKVTDEGQQLVHQILKGSVPGVVELTAPPELVAVTLTQALSRIGLNGVWVMTDGLERWVDIDLDRVKAILSTFLSTLPLFEHAQFAYKLILPAELETALLKSASLRRHRVDGYHLDYDEHLLQAIVEARLALAFGVHTFSLHQLGQPVDALKEWLIRTGGYSPYAWLDQLRPLVAVGLRKEQSLPLHLDDWKFIARTYPPRIHLDEMHREVVIGGRRLSSQEFTSTAFDLLSYFYHHSNQIISRAELYYKGFRGYTTIPAFSDETYEAPKTYEGLIDTNIWRLRQLIEPDPSEPILLVTVRGQGVKLVNRW